MFGMGMNEIMVILVIALIFLGPEKLPEAASKISKGIRDIRKQSRELTHTIENDAEIGGAIRELKSALRGEDRRPPVRKEPPAPELAAPGTLMLADPIPADPPGATMPLEAALGATEPLDAAHVAAPAPTLRLPVTAGERSDDDAPDDATELAKLIRPATGTAKREDRG